MNKLAIEKPGCIKYALEILGDKWTGLLLRELCTGPKTFSDLEKSAVGISPRTLSQRLEMMQENGIIAKSLYCEKPARCNYALTEKGQELQEILRAMARWSSHYNCC